MYRRSLVLENPSVPQEPLAGEATCTAGTGCWRSCRIWRHSADTAAREAAPGGPAGFCWPLQDLGTGVHSLCMMLGCAQSLQLCPTYCTRLLSPWAPAGKNTGVGCHALLQGIFLTQGSYPCALGHRGAAPGTAPGAQGVLQPKDRIHVDVVWGLPRCVWARESTAPAQGNWAS